MAETGGRSDPVSKFDAGVRSYRTEVVIPDERVIVLTLPDDMPIGPAIVTVCVEKPSIAQAPQSLGETLGLDQQDIEWWDEP